MHSLSNTFIFTLEAASLVLGRVCSSGGPTFAAATIDPGFFFLVKGNGPGLGLELGFRVRVGFRFSVGSRFEVENLVGVGNVLVV